MPYKEVDIKSEIRNRLQEDPSLREAYDAATDEYEFLRQLAVIRNELGFTQQDVAKRAGMTQQMVSRIEKVDNSPTLRNFMRYIRGMGLQIAIVRKDTHVDRHTETM